MQIELVNLPVRMYQNTRQSCPVCGGYNTLSMTKLPPSGVIKYHCFKADCNVAGYYNKGLSKEEMKEVIKNDKRYNSNSNINKSIVIPDYFVSGIATKSIEKYLEDKNCMDAYINKKSFEIMYDPKQNRVVFLKHDNFITKDKIVGGVGRALNKKTFPKSYNYPWGTNDPFIAWQNNKEIDKHSTVIIVEDPASACVASTLDNTAGLALLGTTLNANYIPFILKFNYAIIALDKDAYNKNISIARRLMLQGINVNTWLLDKDLKDEESIDIIENKYARTRGT